MSKLPFPVIAALTTIAIAYSNKNYIADIVMPYVQVKGSTFDYQEIPKAQNFTPVDTEVGRLGSPNLLELGSIKKSGMVVDHGLDTLIPQADIDEAKADKNITDPVENGIETLTGYLVLGREIRVANFVQNALNYGTSLTLSGSSRFSDITSNPLEVLLDRLSIPLIRPNLVVMGATVWKKLSLHPKLVSAALGNSGENGVIDEKQLAKLLQVERVVVGMSRQNTANEGQTEIMGDIWGGNSISLLYINPLANTKGGTTWGFTPRKGTRFAGAKEEANIGLYGGKRARVGESVNELVVAVDAGTIILNVL
jgi:hypothetical protein